MRHLHTDRLLFVCVLFALAGGCHAAEIPVVPQGLPDDLMCKSPEPFSPCFGEQCGGLGVLGRGRSGAASGVR